MTGITRRDLLKYAAYGSVLAGSGLFTTSVTAGEKISTAFAYAGEEKPLAICISDFHIGERYGGLTDNPGHPDRYQQLDGSDPSKPFVRKEFMDFLLYCKAMKGRHGKIKYLIILGDMWDLAMNNQESTFALSSVFFRQLKELNKGLGIGELFENVIYVPGNHDHHFWKMLQERYWVTQRLEQGNTPLEMPRIAGLTLDASTGAVQRAETPTGENRIPLHNLASPLLGLDSETPVYVAYPHIFLKKTNNEYTLLTHGHLFEPNWNMVTMIFGELMKNNDVPLTIRNIEMFNSITTEMHSHALGQTPPYEFWEKIYDLQYTDKVPPEWQKGVRKILEAHFYLRKDMGGDSQTQSKKYHDIQALQNQRGLVEHYLAQAEKEGLDSSERVTSLIYGHTHIPSFGETFVRYQDQKKMPLDIHNTGGWVNINPDIFHMPQPTLVDKNGAVRQLRFRYPDS
ncbi:MAG: metallophosphoesterase [Desulfovibrionales bacterium]|nr:metallophosphoesterase [Desulfovibrionales bacterium]